MVRRLFLGFLTVTVGLFLIQQVALAPLWSNFFSSGASGDDIDLVYLLQDFICSQHVKISERDLKEIISSVVCSGEKFSIDPRLIAALIAAESGFRKTAVSQKGARGLTQLMPDKCQGFDWRDIERNVDRGTGYLRLMLDRFDSIPLALAAYNAGPNRIATGGTWPRETRYYVQNVTAYYNRLLGVVAVSGDSFLSAKN